MKTFAKNVNPAAFENPNMGTRGSFLFHQLLSKPFKTIRIKLGHLWHQENWNICQRNHPRNYRTPPQK
jgi:predicted glycosyltransferase involved in capsule biosynthesis